MSANSLLTPSEPAENRPTILQRLRLVIALAVFGVLLMYSYVKLVVIPYMGFKHHPTLGTVGDVFEEVDPEASVMTGDLLLMAGSVTWQDYRNDARLPFFLEARHQEVILLQVQRGDQVLTIPWRVIGPTLEEISDRFTLLWVPYVFWLMGTIVLFTRQGWDSRRTMYVAFTYLTAIWVMAGLVSSAKIFYSSILLHMGVWMSVPVYWHFHWLFPQPLPRFNRRAFLLLYLVFALLAAAEWFAWLPTTAFVIGVLLALLGSMILLFAHLISNPEQRRTLGALVLAVAISIAPGSLIMISYFTNSQIWSGASALLIVPAIPVAYYYAVFAPSRGGVGTNTNRMITPIFFATITYSFLALGMLAAQIWQPTTGREVPLAVDISVMVGLFTAILYPIVQETIDRRILGISIPPTQVLETYSARITTSLEIKRLAAVLRDEVLPSLSIHQAALVAIQPGSSTSEILFEMGIPRDQTCEPDHYLALKQEAGRWRGSEHSGELHEPCPWAHLILPLSLQDQEIGLLLLGRRDLGGSYSQADISALQALADQTALALVNIRQAEQLHALYQHDVLNQEAMQLHLARELHDQVLNQLAALANQLDDQRFTPELQSAYQQTVKSIRDMISGLRPSMLNYGLYSALLELVDDLNAQAAGKTSIHLNLPASSERYPPEVELQLFRIVQQAAQNALQHSGASRVEISGRLSPDAAEFFVHDNGKGLDIPSPFDVISLLEKQHFGLAGMYERAAIINANLDIGSTHGTGTQISVRWLTTQEPSS